MRPDRRIEDRIRELTARLMSSPDEEHAALIHELQIVLAEYLRRVENKTVAGVLAWPDLPEERRQTGTKDVLYLSSMNIVGIDQ